jgi:SAM-dependent methyltransferase
MSDVEQRLAESLTAQTTELIPYLSYLLQDLWELGSSPKDIIALLSEHVHVTEKTQVLDLACGKGAVSVHIAGTWGCRVKGIDIMTEFIDFAQKKPVNMALRPFANSLSGISMRSWRKKRIMTSLCLVQSEACWGIRNRRS